MPKLKTKSGVKKRFKLTATGKIKHGVAGEKAGQYAYRDRKVKKRSFRALWIQRINAAVRAEGLSYSQFMHGAKLAGIELDRKVMADLAMNEGAAFGAIIQQAKAALPAA